MPTIVDGKAIAQKIQKELKQTLDTFASVLSFHIIYVGSDPVIDNFITYKKEFGEEIGVHVVVHRFPEDIAEETLIKNITDISTQADGVIVQLPLPAHLGRTSILDAVPPHKDIDVLGSSSRELFSRGITDVFPPVTGAIVEIFNHHHINLLDKDILLVGNGTLVGYPMALWLEREGYNYNIIDHTTDDRDRNEYLKGADVIISGAGQPHMITPDRIKENVILIDAGTSEAGKKIIGDIHPDCREKASLITPVPGGIGPMTIALLYRNLVTLYTQKHD